MDAIDKKMERILILMGKAQALIETAEFITKLPLAGISYEVLMERKKVMDKLTAMGTAGNAELAGIRAAMGLPS